EIDRRGGEREEEEGLQGARHQTEIEEIAREDERREDEGVLRPLVRAHGFEEGLHSLGRASDLGLLALLPPGLCRNSHRAIVTFRLVLASRPAPGGEEAARSTEERVGVFAGIEGA